MDDRIVKPPCPTGSGTRTQATEAMAIVTPMARHLRSKDCQQAPMQRP